MTAEESEVLRRELTSLFKYIERVRQEIASINRDSENKQHFDSMGEQLDAIVGATEEATNTIMARMEDNGAALDELREKIKDPGQLALLERITDNDNDVFEACSFQDITGQRVSKIVKSITYMEERVCSLIDILGRDEVNKIEVVPAEETEEEKLLRGPALETEQSLAQDDIDALFD